MQMRSFLLMAALGGLFHAATAQTNISFVGQLSYQQLHNSDLSNLWGYADEEGNEYALVGVNGNDAGPGGFSVVDLSDPTDPQEIFFLEGPASIWREIKVWGDHAYITTEAENGGLTIVDLSPLPQSNALPSTVWFDPAWDTSHSLFIDENGRLYIHGANEGAGGVIMYDLTNDPMSPVRVGMFDQWYVHDSFARGDTLYAGHILNGFFSIVDVSDPSSPVLLGQQNTPSDFTHNTWLDASGRYLYTTDERPNAYVAAYDVSDPTDIQFMGRLRSDPGSDAIPHNTYWLPGDYVVQSYYTYGISIYDASDPTNMVEVGHYDTSPLTGGGFFGAWGVYPFLPSGRLLVSDIEEGLFVLEPTYVRGCRLQGTVTSAAGGAPVALAQLSLGTTDAIDATGIDGTYVAGTLEPGEYTVTVNAPTFFPATVEGVLLETGEVTILDIELDPLPTYSVSGLVRTAGTLDPVPGAQVWLVNNSYTFQTTSASDGSFSFPAVYDGVYTVDVGAWGWQGACPADLVVNGADIPDWTIDLEAGYSDDFALDLGWQVSTTAVRGAWARGNPAGTIYQGATANPGDDVEGDCRDKAYVTGNSGGSPNSDDVDDGGTLLTSPVFDASDLPEAHVRFFYWFFNAGGQSQVDDAFIISLTDGTDTVAIQTVTAADGPMSQWRFSNIRIADHMVPTETMRLLVYTADEEPNGHLVEAGLDEFAVVQNGNTAVADPAGPVGLHIWPVPASEACTVVLPGGMEGSVRVLDALGRAIGPDLRTQGGRIMVGNGLANGTYTVVVLTTDGDRFTGKIQLLR